MLEIEAYFVTFNYTSAIRTSQALITLDTREVLNSHKCDYQDSRLVAWDAVYFGANV